MRKILKFLKKSTIPILIIIALLVVQAVCDLSLPDYTSRIINIGVQQGGIETSLPDVIRKDQLDEIMLFIDPSKQKDIKDNYHLINKTEISKKEYDSLLKKYPVLKDEKLYLLNDISKSDEKELEENLSRPMLTHYMLTSTTEEAVKIQLSIKESLPENLKEFSIIEILKMMPEEQLAETRTNMNKQFEEMPDSIAVQSAVASTAAEYKAIGIDTNSMQIKYIIFSGLKMLGLALLSMATTILVSFIGARTAASLARDLRKGVYDKVLSFGTTEFKQFGVASLITRTTNDIQQVQQMMIFTLRIIFYAPIIGIGGVIKALNANSTMAWIIAVAVMSVMSLMIIMFVLVMPKFKKVQKQIDKLNQVTREILSGIPVIRAFSNQDKEKKRFDNANRNLKKTTLFVGRSMSLMMPTMMFIMNAITILIVWKGAHGINDGLMQVGDMLAFIQYTMQIVMSFLMIAMFSIMLPRAGVSLGRIKEILNTKPAVTDPKTPKTFSKRTKGLIEFKDVSFKYPDSDENLLTDINFVAEPGKVTAFIGSTGSGKSTLVNLIPRFFDVTKGEIRVNDINIKDVNLKDLHSKIGFVPQKGVLFSGTIKSNISYGNPDASIEEIERAARIAQAEKFIDQKEEKYASPIAQGGTNVSGGQKQRLSIARAIATDPEIYIFDDSFSALDFKTDAELRKALSKETRDATVLIVAQRISTILSADQIIVLNEGKIVGKGTHKELLETCDIYREIASSQLTKEELEDE